jgi:hypothetical protein
LVQFRLFSLYSCCSKQTRLCCFKAALATTIDKEEDIEKGGKERKGEEGDKEI